MRSDQQRQHALQPGVIDRYRGLRLHRLWLGPIYAWAGECRKVNIAKGGLQFSHALLVLGLLADLERGPLARHGRIVRVIAMLMGLQAGLPQLDFSPLEGRGKERYFARIRAAISRDYAPLALQEMRARPLLRTVGHISS